MRSFIFAVLVFSISAFAQDEAKLAKGKILTEKDVKTGAMQLDAYLPMLKGKRVAVLANQTTKIYKTHLVDSLKALGVNLVKIFGPEHGFRGQAAAGEKVNSNIDEKTGLPVVSLYGKHMKPTAEDLKDVDVVVYDIQDVGVRFYTYISSMSYMMDACAQSNVAMIVLDRPNPNGFYVDGPVLEEKYTSFLGLHNIPLIYGMTAGEYASMVNGEHWLTDGKECNLTIIHVVGYTHSDRYQLPEKPSPNLPNQVSIYLYPQLGLFEGTVMSMGRGTDMPFQVLGHPKYKGGLFKFKPVAMGVNKTPKYLGQTCLGINLAKKNNFDSNNPRMSVEYLIQSYKAVKTREFFDSNFNFHAGNDWIQSMIIEGKPASEIEARWKDDVVKFKSLRKRYLIYSDFE